MALSTLILVCLVFVLAGFTKGIIGLGLPTIAMGLLAVVLPPAEAAALLILPSLVTNVWQMLDGPHFGRLLRRLWPLNVGVCLGTWLGANVVLPESIVPANLLGLFASVLGMIVGSLAPPCRQETATQSPGRRRQSALAARDDSNRGHRRSQEPEPDQRQKCRAQPDSGAGRTEGVGDHR